MPRPSPVETFAPSCRRWGRCWLLFAVMPFLNIFLVSDSPFSWVQFCITCSIGCEFFFGLKNQFRWSVEIPQEFAKNSRSPRDSPSYVARWRILSKDEKGPFFGLFSAQKSSEFSVEDLVKKCKSISANIHYWTIPIIGSQSSLKPSSNIGDILLDIPGKWHKKEAQYHRNHHPKSGFSWAISSTAPPKDQDFHCSLKSRLWQPLTPPILHHWSLASAVPNDPSDPAGMYLRSGCLWLKLKWNKCCF